MSQTNNERYKYTPDEMSQEAFLKRFVVRKEVFEEIFDELQEMDYSVPNQHYIIIGQRGQGKTTLLRKLKIEVENNPKLSKFLLPVKFSEEQYGLRGLCRFWEEIADYLEDHYKEMFDGLFERIEAHIDEESYPLKCFDYLEKELKKRSKKLLMLVDNIDEFLSKLKPDEQHRLREILLTNSSFVIVGGSTKMFEQQYDYSKPFYEFFKIIRLEGLSFEESAALLRVLGDEKQTKKIEYIIEHTPERIEALRRITGGVPRTMIMLFDIFVEDNADAFDDLMRVLDDVTPLYKDRMDKLPPVLQEIVHTIALNWDGMSTKEIARKTRMESKVVSAQMKQLEKYQIVISESVGKNKIYLIKERFFNIWYLMRYGRKKDRARVEWLVKFLLAWYGTKELETKAKAFRDKLAHGEHLNEHYVFMMTEAMGYTGYLKMEDEHKLKQTAKGYLKQQHSSYVREVSKSDKEVLKEAFELRENGDLEGAIHILRKSGKESGIILDILGMLYFIYGDAGQAEEYFLKAIESGNTDAMNNLGILYAGQKIYNKAEEYFLKAIKSSDTDALNSLAWFYYERRMKHDKALEYAHQAYDTQKIFEATHTYAVILLWQEMFEQSYRMFEEWLSYDGAVEKEGRVTEYFLLLMAKGQYYKAKAFFEMPKYQLKERYKPLWYALMTLMQDEFPAEIKKMGSELKETVDEVIAKIEVMREKYSI